MSKRHKARESNPTDPDTLPAGARATELFEVEICFNVMKKPNLI